MHEAVRTIHENAHLLKEEAPKAEQQGMITEKTVRVMKESGGVRLLQAKDLGGYEAHPNDFFEWVRAVAQYNPSAGWIAGVVGIHPWEVSLMDPTLQQEIYGTDPDTWTASPYAPFGRATRVEGGFQLTGEWPYSTGQDWCEWTILGGIVLDDEGNIGNPPEIRHFVLPKGDYEIVPDSWNVMGLQGTGSHNVRMENQFVPEYRTVIDYLMKEGVYSDERRPGNPLYQMGFPLMFSAAIASGTMGIARGFIDNYRDYVNIRVAVNGTVAKTDPFQLTALARAEADWRAGVAHMNAMIDELYEQAKRGEKLTMEQRLDFRNSQVRAVDRVVTSIDEMYRISGANGVWKDKPLERYFRDLHTGGAHICNVREDIQQAFSAFQFGVQPAPNLFA